MVGRIITLGAAFFLVFAAASVQADVVGGEDVIIGQPPPAPPQRAMVMQQSVTAPPPPWVTIESKSLGAGLGISWGKGSLLFEGQRYGFSVKGVSLGDLGASQLSAEGGVRNLERLSDFAGHYVAVEAGAAAGVGASALSMRNEHGVVISLQSELQGVRLKLGTEGFRIVLE